MPGSSALVLVLAYLGGYIFLARSYFTRYRIRHFEGHRLLFEAGLVALIFLFPSRLACSTISASFPALYRIWHDLVPINFFGTAVGAVLLAFISAELVNWSFRIGDRSEWPSWNRWTLMVRAIDRYGSPLEKLLFDCFSRQRMSTVNLKNDKIYVGYVVSTFDLDNARFEYFEILPMISGYRESGSRSIVFTTEYYSAYQSFLADDEAGSAESSIDPADFRIVIPVSEIFNVGPFDSDFYGHFQHEPKAEDVSLADALHSVGTALGHLGRLWGRYRKK